MQHRSSFLAAFALLTCTGPSLAQVALNEIFARHSSQNREFIELAGPPGTSLDGHLILAVDGESARAGIVDLVVDLSGHSIGADGHFVVGSSLVDDVDLILPGVDFLGDRTWTAYLVESQDVAAILALEGVDVDPEDDSHTTIPLLARVLDKVALADAGYAAGRDRVFDGALAVASQDELVPPGIFRGGGAPGAWCDRFLHEHLEMGSRTPGAPNHACPAPLPPSLELRAEDGEAGDYFGTSIDLGGDGVVVGAIGDDDLGYGRGAAYVFDATTGAQRLKLLPDDTVGWTRAFGRRVAIDGNLVVVGTESIGLVGAAYVFDVTSGA